MCCTPTDGKHHISRGAVRISFFLYSRFQCVSLCGLCINISFEGDEFLILIPFLHALFFSFRLSSSQIMTATYKSRLVTTVLLFYPNVPQS